LPENAQSFHSQSFVKASPNYPKASQDFSKTFSTTHPKHHQTFTTSTAKAASNRSLSTCKVKG
jgi:hypothetical protein